MRMSVAIETLGVKRSMLGLAQSFSADLSTAVYRAGAMMRTRVRANASGRPGPRAQTGDYRRSISQTNTIDGDVPVALVHTNRPQAMRLEYGFVDTDALGRRYNQAPLPHWGPAAEKIGTDLEREASNALARAMRTFWDGGPRRD